MEKKLKAMFDYQSFEGNRSLAKLIRETEERNSRMLTEDELAFAAGGLLSAEDAVHLTDDRLKKDRR